MSDGIELTIALPVKDGEARLVEQMIQVDELLRRLDRPCEILAVDDGSRDGTASILARAARDRPWMTVITHPENRGKGAALKTAAAASRGAVLVTVDADATYALDRVDAYLAAIADGADAAIGNRRDLRSQFVLHPSDFSYVGRRHAIGWVFSRLARLIVGLRVEDCQAGFKVYRGDVARRLFAQVDAQRFAFDVEILALLQHHGCRVDELPITYVYRHQPSTVKVLRDGLRMLKRLVRVRHKLKRLRRSGHFADHTVGDYQHRAREEGHPIQRFWHAKKWPMVADKLVFGSSDRVLEVGAGSSEVPLQTSARVAMSCAVDANLAPLEFLRDRQVAGGSPAVRLVGASMGALPFRDGAFDKVIVLEVIEHLPGEIIPGALAELRRVLAPGGQLLVTTPNYRSTWPILEWLVDHLGGAAEMGGKQHVSRFHPARLRAALEEQGFRIEQAGSVYHLSPFLHPLAPRAAERAFAWELRRGGRLGPILYAVATASGG